MTNTHKHHDIRAQIVTEGARSLLIINGGGLVALLSFLSNVWSEREDVIISAILQGIWFLAIALVSAVANFFFRYWASTAFQRPWPIRHKVFWFLEWISIIISFVFFLLALETLVSGARSAI